jgi:hypothetical protein
MPTPPVMSQKDVNININGAPEWEREEAWQGRGDLHAV